MNVLSPAIMPLSMAASSGLTLTFDPSLLQSLRHHVLSTYAEDGKKWLSSLEKKIAQIKDYWHLSDVVPVDNMSYHFVAKALQDHHRPVVIKVGCDKQQIENEAFLLKQLKGYGVIDLFDECLEDHALLLDQARPGTALKLLYPIHIDDVMRSYIHVMNRLHSTLLRHYNTVSHISQWLISLERKSSFEILNELLDQAIEIKNRLLKTCCNERLLHGDLHLDNILLHQDQWLCIDPKGVIGEREFELAAFDFSSERESHQITKEELAQRIKRLAAFADCSVDRIRQWVFVRNVLKAVWQEEDGLDPTFAIELAKKIF